VTIGPGKYDKLATHVRKRSKGRAVVVIVLDGEHGSGFSVQGAVEFLVAARLPTLLRTVAAQIDGDITSGNACPTCGSDNREQRALVSARPVRLCPDKWHRAK